MSLPKKTVGKGFYVLHGIAGDPVPHDGRQQYPAHIERIADDQDLDAALAKISGRTAAGVGHAHTHCKHIHRRAERPTDNGVKQVRYAMRKRRLWCTFNDAVDQRKAEQHDCLGQIKLRLPPGVDGLGRKNPLMHVACFIPIVLSDRVSRCRMMPAARFSYFTKSGIGLQGLPRVWQSYAAIRHIPAGAAYKAWWGRYPVAALACIIQHNFELYLLSNIIIVFDSCVRYPFCTIL